jgi:hypothetical protein
MKTRWELKRWVGIAGVSIFLCAEVQASPASKEDARLAVRGWLRNNPAPVGAKLGAKIRFAETAIDEDGTPLFHIVSLSPEGYVICSADTEIEPILAFSANGRYEADPENPLQALIERDARGRMQRLRKPSAHATARAFQAKAASKWNALRNSGEGQAAPMGSGLASVNDPRVDPFIQSHWNQGAVSSGACYNYYTPPYAAGSLSNYFCGCNNTAWAQVMRYFQYPTRAVGAPSFQIWVDGISTNRNLRGGDGAGGAYRWDLMPPDPANASTEERQAIGALCADIGVASGTSYSSGGSGAGTSEQTLRDVFYFSNARHVCGQDSLANAVRPNLDARLPVVLSLWSGAGGHAVLCDGYGFNFSATYYHLNLGWGGQKDAWYNLPDVDTDWYAYDTLRGFDCNIYTNGTGEILSGRVLAGGLPVAGAQVTAIGGGQTNFATTDARGIYALTRLPSNKEYVLTAQKSGLEFDSRTAFTGLSPSWSSVTGNTWSNDFSSEASSDTPELSVTPASQSVGSATGTTTFAVTNAGGGTMEYAASEAEAWLSIVAGESGTNGGTIVVSHLANPNPAARTGTITVADGDLVATCTVVQAAAVVHTYYRDADGDGYGNPSATTNATSPPAGYVANNADWNDNKSSVHPGAPEIPDGLDNNGDGQIDEGARTSKTCFSLAQSLRCAGSGWSRTYVLDLTNFRSIAVQDGYQTYTVNYSLYYNIWTGIYLYDYDTGAFSAVIWSINLDL